MAVLVIDVGNSRLKWARAEGAQLGPSRAAAHSKWSRADYARRLRRPAGSVDAILVSSVAGPKVRAALTAVARTAKVPIRFLKVPTRGAGITVGYREPWRLGVDRFAGLVGAHHLFAGIPVCVVGVGTAMTLDLVGRDGRHFGGAIIPSPALMLETLLTRTHGIRRRAQGGSVKPRGPFGRSTRDAIREGTCFAAAAAIDRLVAEGTVLAGAKPLVVLTGGGAPAVRPLILSHCVRVPDLVLRGLAVLSQPPQRQALT